MLRQDDRNAERHKSEMDERAAGNAKARGNPGTRPALQGLSQHIHHVIAGREIEAQRRGQENQQVVELMGINGFLE